MLFTLLTAVSSVNSKDSLKSDNKDSLKSDNKDSLKSYNLRKIDDEYIKMF
jgi:hypothetical protein